VVDANALRRKAKAHGDPLDRVRDLQYAYLHLDGRWWQTPIRVESFEHPIYGWRWFVRCPVCWRLQTLLFFTKRGPKCRYCLHLGYPPKRKP